MKYWSKLLVFLLSNLLIKKSIQVKLKYKMEKLDEFLASDACRSKKQLITSDRNEEFELVETTINNTLSLACHFCDETDDNAPKLWFRQSRFQDGNVTEVDIGMEDELSSNRIYMKPDHTLVFNRTIEEDAALYYCSGRLGEDKQFKFNYLVDIINVTAKKVTVGNLKDWTNFEETSYTDINEKFKSSIRSDFAFIRSRGINVEVVGLWQPWGTCDGCMKIRLRIAECRLQPSLNDRNITWIHSLNDKETFLVKSFEMSCYSLGFRKFFPNISDDLFEIGNYGITEPCYAPCRVNSKSKSSVRYRNTIVLAEGDHFTLICPEVTFISEVIWEKDGVAISSNIQEGNIIVDSFSNLYIIFATGDEEGNYTCFVDGVKMQEVKVFVRKHLVITTEAFFRHFQYLGFIFLFSSIFYCAGIILVWNRRHTFKKIDFNKIAEERFGQYLNNYDTND